MITSVAPTAAQHKSLEALEPAVSLLVRLETIEDTVRLVHNYLRGCCTFDVLTVALECDRTWDAYVLERGLVRIWTLDRAESDLLELAYGASEPMVLADLTHALEVTGLECPVSALTDQTAQAWLGLPLRVGQRRVGVLTVHSSSANAFTPATVQGLRRLCEFVAMKLAMLSGTD